ncbi:ATP-binding protein [Paenibacillus bouchesdurhonensis]|uniref:ATP-binding protein n=1 Tax=Paenibacillus bouchesdurhonensis TaxID=1870990 RepID=UPI001901953D|nr:ATP-binding protein [Paenibacillus bouchesdurhonensis]
MTNEAVFRPRARLMSQLGEQLIKDETIAVLELIKNAYDADAKNVDVLMENVDDSESARIIIEDDGDGMTFDIVKNNWMEPGTDHKEKKLKKMIEENSKSKLNRLPMGEKGIGRFGVHKLGHKVTLITRSEHEQEIFLSIDWSIFDSNEYLSDVSISIIERSPTQLFSNNSPTGTRIIIENLKTPWTRGKVRDLQRAITSLNSPFEALDSFKVNLKVSNPEWLKGLICYEDIKDYALFKVNMTLKNDKILNYDYKFMPWNTLDKLDPRNNVIDAIQMKKLVITRDENKKTQKSFVPIDLSEFKIGTVEIELLGFDLDSSLLKFGEVSDTSGLRKYLKANGGIFVYRDKIRVYSSEESDWLNLNAKRVNSPADKISTNLVLGSVKIQRSESLGLQEKTNREGFIEDTAYERFKDAVLFAVEKFEHDRSQDKYLIRKYYGATSRSEPVIAEVASLREKIQSKVSDKTLKNEIFGCLDNIERDYQHITGVYQKSSSIGLSMSVVLHEIEKVIAELERVIDEDEASLHVRKLVKRLGSLTDGYASVVKSGRLRNFNFKDVIKQALFLVDFRLSAHKVHVEGNYVNKTDDFIVKGNENLITSNIINIIDNAIWWLSYVDVPNKKIFFDITREIPGYLSIIIADNGKGFTIPTDMITKPFITDKMGGMGLGLHLASEIMKQHNGDVIFPDFYDLELPLEYKHGAIIALAFKEE